VPAAWRCGPLTLYDHLRDKCIVSLEGNDVALAHPAEAERISAHARAYVKQFFDPRRELLTALLVLKKYFRLTGQLED